MRAILEFNLPEEKEEFKLAQDAADYMIVLSDLDNWLRSKLKYENLTDQQSEAYEWTRKHLHELAADRGVKI